MWGTLAVVLTIGCNPLATIGFLAYKDPVQPARCPFVPKEGGEGSEILVALFVSQSTGQSFDFAGAENTIASEMARKIPELAKENKQKVTVIPTSKVNQFKFKNPTWKDMHASAWGKALGVDYVLEIHLDKLSLYQPGSRNQLYEGRAEVSVFMYDVAEVSPSRSRTRIRSHSRRRASATRRRFRSAPSRRTSWSASRSNWPSSTSTTRRAAASPRGDTRSH